MITRIDIFNEEAVIRDSEGVMIRSSAEDIGDTGFDDSFGYGLIDAHKALTSTKPKDSFYASGRVQTKVLNDGTVYEYTDEDWRGNNYGKLIKETRPDKTYRTFSKYI